MSLRRAFHELVSENSLYYEVEQHIQIYPWTKFGELPESYKEKLESAKAYLGKKWCFYNKKPKTVIERKRRRAWK